MHRRVAGALASSGRTPEAIEHWLAAGVFEPAADAIAAHGIGLAATAPETVAGWLDRLPADLCERPVLRLLAGRLAMGEGDFSAAVEHCRAGVSGLEREQAPEALLWAARLALTDAQIAALDLEAAAEACGGAGDGGPEAGSAAVFCALLHAALLARLGVRGPTAPWTPHWAAKRARAARSGSRRIPGPLPRTAAGRLDDALEHINEGIAALEAQDPYNRLAYVLAFKMAIHEARGEPEQALETFDHLLAAARRTGLAGFIGAGARLSAATILARLGSS